MGTLRGRCDCGGTLLVRYDLEWIAKSASAEQFRSRAPNLWRYRELLPVNERDAEISLGEGFTPLVRLRDAPLGLQDLWVKREEQNPTGSFKARGFSVAVSLAKKHGHKKLAVASNGNAGSALAAYGAFAGLEVYVLLPKDCPVLIQEEIVLHGARTALVDGYIQDGGKIIAQGVAQGGWFNVNTLQEPGRLEGKKTMGFELAEQFDWRAPDVIVYPTGGGSGLIGMWKAFSELRELGWLQGPMPRFISVQESGCDPLVQAVRDECDEIIQPKPTTASPIGLRVPQPPDAGLLLKIIRESGGGAVSVSKHAIRQAQVSLGRRGICASPEGAATWACLESLLSDRLILPNERIVLFNTSHALKYVPANNNLHLPVISSYEEWCEESTGKSIGLGLAS